MINYYYFISYLFVSLNQSTMKISSSESSNDFNDIDQMLPFMFDLNPLTSLIYVDNEINLNNLGKSLCKALILGIDTETKPNFTPKKYQVCQALYPTSLIQIAVRSSTSEEVFIIDMLQLSLNMKLLQLLDTILINTMQDKKIIKIGQGLLQDMKELTRSYPSMKCFHHVENIIETHSIVKQLQTDLINTISLKNLVKEYLNCNLIKKQQLSDWSRRPLTSAQLHYASCDALVLLRLFDVFCYELENKLDITSEEVTNDVISKLGICFDANKSLRISDNVDIDISWKNSIVLKDGWQSIQGKKWIKQQYSKQSEQSPLNIYTSAATTNSNILPNDSKKRKLNQLSDHHLKGDNEIEGDNHHIPLPIGTGKHLKFEIEIAN